MKRESGSNPEQPPLLYLTWRGIYRDMMSYLPLGYSEKAALSPIWRIMSQETCRNFLGLTNLGEKSAADLSIPVSGFCGLHFSFSAKAFQVYL